MNFSINGVPVYIDDKLGVEYHRKQVRFPRSKRKRIRRKWSKQNKNFRNWSTQKPVCYQVGNSFVVNSTFYSQLKSQVPSR